MANPHRGEVEIKAGEKAYTLVFTINAICDVEEETGADLLADLTRLSKVRLMLYAGLRTRHPEISRADAGAIIETIGVDVVQQAIVKALEIAFPKKPGKVAGNPQ